MYATESSSPIFISLIAMSCSSDVPDEKDGRALGAQECGRYDETV
jgi:hypothetical protein